MLVDIHGLTFALVSHLTVGEHQREVQTVVCFCVPIPLPISFSRPAARTTRQLLHTYQTLHGTRGMAGLQSLVLFTLMTWLTLCTVYCHDTRDEEDYPTRYLDDADVDDLLEREAIHRLLDGIQQQRQKKDMCNLATGSGPCNFKDAIKAVKVNQFVERFGRRKRHLTNT